MRMTETTKTDDLLLARVSDPLDREAWQEFASIYRPLVYRVGRRLGLQDADAQNLAQDVLQKICKKVAQWESGKPAGSFRRWLSIVARNAALDAIRRVQPDAPRGGTSVQVQLQQIAKSADASDTLFRLEWEREAFRCAARRIRDEFSDATWTAFWETMIEGKSCGELAEQLGKSLGAIYIARSRVVRRLKLELENTEWMGIAASDDIPEGEIS
jgi:RNA polymerase sigma-70 factor (ECF subfamily)